MAKIGDFVKVDPDCIPTHADKEKFYKVISQDVHSVLIEMSEGLENLINGKRVRSWWVEESYIIEVKIQLEAPIEQKKSAGMFCSGGCHEYYHMAEPNQPDGSLICWSCRH